MFDYIFDLGVTVVLSTLKTAFKNPKTKADIRRAMLKIYTQIGIVFAYDDEFIMSAVDAHNLDGEKTKNE